MSTNLETLLSRVASLAGASPDLLRQLAQVGVVRTFNREDYVWRAGDPPGGLCIVRSGVVKITRIGQRGRAMVCGFFGPGDSIGELALLKRIPYPADASVITPKAAVLYLPASVLNAHLEQNPALLTSMTSGMHCKLSTLHHTIDVLSAGSVESRLATALLKLHAQFGDEFDDGGQVIPIALLRRDLADYVATTVETTIRIMKKWERAHLVERSQLGLSIADPDALQRISLGANCLDVDRFEQLDADDPTEDSDPGEA